MFHSLQVQLHLHVMVSLKSLSLCLSISNLSFQVEDLVLGVLKVLLHHISIHLDVVPLQLKISGFVLQQVQMSSQLGRRKFGKLIIRLLFFLLLGLRHFLFYMDVYYRKM